MTWHSSVLKFHTTIFLHELNPLKALAKVDSSHIRTEVTQGQDDCQKKKKKAAYYELVSTGIYVVHVTAR